MIDNHQGGEPSRLLRMPEVMARLASSRPTIYRLIQRGEFPKPLKIGKSSAWKDSDVSGYINGLARGR